MENKSKKAEIPQSPFAGQIVTRYFTERRTRRSALARLMGTNLKSILRYQNSASVKTGILWELSYHLKHNFFMDIATLLPKEFSTYAPKETVQQDRIKELEMEIALLKAKNEALMEVLKK